MDNTLTALTDLIRVFGGLIAIIGSYKLMKQAKFQLQAGQVSQDSLTNNEKTQVYIYALLNPLFAGAIFYYGWRKVLPIKAKNANDASLIAFVVWIILFATGIFRFAN